MWPVKTNLVGGVFSVHVPTYTKNGDKVFLFQIQFYSFSSEALLESFLGTSSIMRCTPYSKLKLRLIFHITHRVICCFHPENVAIFSILVF